MLVFYSKCKLYLDFKSPFYELKLNWDTWNYKHIKKRPIYFMSFIETFLELLRHDAEELLKQDSLKT